MLVNPAGGCRPAARLGDDVDTTVNKVVTGSPSVCVGG